MMQGYVSVQQLAEKWQVTPASVYSMCKAGKIDGAYKSKGHWYVPYNSTRPADSRLRSGKYKKGGNHMLPLPLGISDYCLASSEYYYVDKTLMIKEFLDERPQVSLFTRPRRFGKTLNMDMFRVFFEKTDTNTSVYFENKAIWGCGEQYRAHQGKYPVIFVTFKDLKCENWEDTFKKLTAIFQDEFARHAELLNSKKCSDVNKEYFRLAISGQLLSIELSNAFLVLTKMLHEHHGIAPIIIIDEYDTPIQQGYTHGFYEPVILFMRNLFSGGLKDNKHLSFGFLTGILRVAKENIGHNNLTINSVLDDKYSKYFGFTKPEVKEMLEYYKAQEHYDDLKAWYDGYCFGETDIFNPWSVINYIRNNCKFGAYWQSTGSTEIIRDILSEAGTDIYGDLRTILEGRSIPAYIDTGVIYPEIKHNPSSVYSFLLVSGYLKAIRSNTTFADGMMCDVMIPNKEITLVYRKEILGLLESIVPSSTALSIQKAIYIGDTDALCDHLRQLLLHSVSSFDTANEAFYHGLVLGLCVLMDDLYFISSNREAGEGRFDIQLMPKKTESPGILIELKAGKGKSNLRALADTALAQINNQQYAADMILHKAKKVFLYGLAFSGKRAEISMQTIENN